MVVRPSALSSKPRAHSGLRELNNPHAIINQRCTSSCHQHSGLHRASISAPGRRRSGFLCRSTDYASNETDIEVLRLPSKTELEPEEIVHVFGYSRSYDKQYLQGEVLGCGSFGVVRECLEIETGRRYAVKTISKIPKRGPPTPRYLLKLRSEVEIMRQLGCSLDAVNLKDVFEDDQHIHLVMQLCEGGALLDRIESRTEEGGYNEKYIARLVRSILRFISQCHAKGFIYRDLKPDNFLFLTNEPNSPLKATDFGLAIHHWPDEPRLASRSGTPAYMAPELVLQSYDEKCDMWSVGMLTYQLLTGRFPYWENIREESLAIVWKAILSEEIDWDAEELQQLSRPAIKFMQTLLQRDPESRPSAAEALEFDWVKEDGIATDRPLGGSVVQRLQRFSTYGALKQMVLKMIVDKMQRDSDDSVVVISSDGENEEEDAPTISTLTDLFKDMDQEGSGQISTEKLTEGLHKQGYVLSDSEVELLAQKMDFDGNKTIDVSEFLTTLIDWSEVQRSKKWQAYLDYVFNMLDLDGNGYISLDELEMLLIQVHGANDSMEEQRVDPSIIQQAKQMLREADMNGDGHISKEEFYYLLKEDHAKDNLSLYDDRLDLHMADWSGSGPSQAVTIEEEEGQGEEYIPGNI